MKVFFLPFLFALATFPVLAQDGPDFKFNDSLTIANLKRELSQSKKDTNRVNQYSMLSWSYMYSHTDTALSYALTGLALARELDFTRGEIWLMNMMGEALGMKGNITKALEIELQALQKAEKLKDPERLVNCYNFLSSTYEKAGDYQKALFYTLKIKADKQAFKRWKKIVLAGIGRNYFYLNQLDSAQYYITQAYEIDRKEKTHFAVIYKDMGYLYEKKGEYTKALEFYKMAKEIDGFIYPGMPSVFNKMGMQDSAIYYGKIVLERELQRTYYPSILEASSLLTEIYTSKHSYDSVYKYQQIMLAAKDSLFSQEKVKYIQNLTFNEEQRQQELKAQKEAYFNQLKLYGLLTLGIVSSLIAFILWRNNQQKQKAYSLLQQQKQETEQQKAKAEQTLEELKATQDQLVEQEKAALENELKLERAAYLSKAIELEMQALRAQMNPHFIFNCLNSINRFILKNESEAASDYLTKFSKLIRLILQNSQSKAVPLENELEALKLYIDMEILRFDGGFDYQISHNNDLEIQDIEVPPLIIQPYVENAIWHGLMHKEGKGHLLIELEWENGILYCQIIDDGVGRKRASELKSKTGTKSKSLGMQITAHRLELINTLQEKETTVEITDLVDSSGDACGTRVLLRIPV